MHQMAANNLEYENRTAALNGNTGLEDHKPISERQLLRPTDS